MVPDWGGRRAQQARAYIADLLPLPCTKVKCGHAPVMPWQAWDLDHIKDRHTHPHLTWDPANWGASHRACNRSDGAAKGNRERRPTLQVTHPELVMQVSGPPCAGKSTWIAQHAGPGDVVIDDIDLATQYGGRDAIPNETWRQWLRDKDQAVSTWAGPGRLWIIQGDPTPIAAGVNVHIIDVDESTCHRRAQQDGRPRVTHARIARWFQRHGVPQWSAPGW